MNALTRHLGKLRLMLLLGLLLAPLVFSRPGRVKPASPSMAVVWMIQPSPQPAQASPPPATRTPEVNKPVSVQPTPPRERNILVDGRHRNYENPFEQPSIGRSVEGRPIAVYSFGNGPVGFAVVGGIHGGYEKNTVALAERMIKNFTEHPEQVPDQVTLYVIPCANPDGYARGPEESGRFNANGVDLNRNWDYIWQPIGGWKEGREVYGGDAPFSEPETKALRNFFTQKKIGAAIFYHSAGGFITTPPNGTNVWGLAECLSTATGYEVLEDGSSSYYDRYDYVVTGDAGEYLAELGIAAIDVELYDHDDPELERNQQGLLEGLDCWLQQR